jgi:predicted enzyme related to lactoylglutathione lyase
MAKSKAKGKGKAKKAAARKPAKKSTKKAAAGRKPAARRAQATPAAMAKPVGPGVVHWEIQARDAAAQQRFYGDLFGWAVDAANPMGYGMVKAAGGPSIGGGIGGTMDGPRATFYVWVPSIEAALEKAAALGGQAVMPRTDLGMVVMGQFRDPEGNVIGLVEG